jgi:tyrosine phenol-lyase
MCARPVAEPYKNKIIETIPIVGPERRLAALTEAGFNPYLLESRDVPFDLLSDNGASAMSDRQWAGLMIGDEAYAGSRNFYELERAVQELFGLPQVVPTHMGRGAVHLVAQVLLPESGRLVATNNTSPIARQHFERRGAQVVDLGCPASRDPLSREPFRGDIDLARLEALLAKEGPRVGMLSLSLAPELTGSLPMRLANLEAASALARKHKLPVVLDASRGAAWAWAVRQGEPGLAGRSIPELMRSAGDAADVLTLSAKEAAFANAGGLVATRLEPVYTGCVSLVVVFEGLHTYGGMAGRDMQAVAVGLREMAGEDDLAWHAAQLHLLGDALKAAGLPVLEPYGLCGVFLDAARLVPQVPAGEFPALAAACAIYQGGGVRVAERGSLSRARAGSTTAAGEAALELVGLCPPRRTYMNSQLEAAAAAIAAVCTRRASIRGLRPRFSPACLGDFSARFEPVDPRGCLTEPPADPIARPLAYEPFRIKAVEPIRVTDRAYRERAMAEAGYNTFLLKSEDVWIDFLTDSGTSAQSTRQWAAMLGADESAAGSRDWRTLERAVQEVLGFRFALPVHQGRAGEHIVSQSMIKSGDTIPGNMYFTTTREHQERAGGTFVDVIVDAAHDSASQHPWKGDIDLAKLEALIVKAGAKNIPYVKYETSVNMAGGQPVSMDNARQVSALCHKHGIQVMFDATRCAENAYMIQKKDPRYKDTPVRDILKELMGLGDGCTISSKKDNLVNIGSFLATNHEDVYLRALEMLPLFEGGPASGGMAARDMAALAQGIHEMVDDDYIRARVEQTQYLGQLLLEAGIPIVEPPGTHAIFLDARRFLPHLDQDAYPAQRLAAEIYLESGVRAMERGNVSAGRDKKTGKNKRPKLELVRLTIPRRVYSREHMRMCSEAIGRVWQRRSEVRGLQMVHEPPQLRFFTARFQPL